MNNPQSSARGGSERSRTDPEVIAAGATAAAFLALIWFRRKPEIRAFAQAAANIFRVSSGSSLVAGLLIGGSGRTARMDFGPGLAASA